MTAQNRWVGYFSDGEVVVYAPELQVVDDKEWVYLWSNATGKVEPYAKDIVRNKLRKVSDNTKVHEALEAFIESVNARKSAIAERHRVRLEALGLLYKGVKPSVPRARRVTHCWSCKDKLDNSIDVECNACGWILCGCGGCGCGRA